jgi:hypothetical protein
MGRERRPLRPCAPIRPTCRSRRPGDLASKPEGSAVSRACRAFVDKLRAFAWPKAPGRWFRLWSFCSVPCRAVAAPISPSSPPTSYLPSVSSRRNRSRLRRRLGPTAVTGPASLAVMQPAPRDSSATNRPPNRAVSGCRLAHRLPLAAASNELCRANALVPNAMEPPTCAAPNRACPAHSGLLCQYDDARRAHPQEDTGSRRMAARLRDPETNVVQNASELVQ